MCLPDQTAFLRLREILTPAISEVDVESYLHAGWYILDQDDPRLKSLGLTVEGSGVRVGFRNLTRVIGKVRLRIAGVGNVVMLNNDQWSGNLNLEARVAGDECLLAFNLCGSGAINIGNLVLRSSRQLFFWGSASTAVDLRVEIEGNDQGIIVGDDALISSSVWIRNFEMHSIGDLDTDTVVNSPVSTVIEKHVWIGQNTVIMTCPRVGGGSIIGACSFVKQNVPRLVAVGGLPARILRTQVSWGRARNGLSAQERLLIQTLRR